MKEDSALSKNWFKRRSDSWEFDDCNSEMSKKLIGALSFVPFKRRSKLSIKYIKKFA